MSDENVNRNDLDIIRDFNDAADGLEDRYNVSAFISAGDRLSRRFGYLMNSAANGIERAELLESMAGVLEHLANQNFEANDSLRSYEITTRVLEKLGVAFVENLREDTIPGHYTTDQLDVVAEKMKSAGKIRDDMAGYFPNRPNSVAIFEQGRAFTKIGADITKASATFGGGKPKSSRPGGGDKPYRRRF